MKGTVARCGIVVVGMVGFALVVAGAIPAVAVACLGGACLIDVARA